MSTVKRLLFLFAAAVLLFTQGCGSLSPYAAKVNGTRISENDLNDELDAMKANKEYYSFIEERLGSQGARVTGDGKDTYDMAFVARILTRQIVFELVEQEIEERKLQVRDADRKKAREEVESQFDLGQGNIFKKFPKSYQDELVERTAQSNVLGVALAGEVDITCASHILLGAFESEPTPDQLNQAKAQAEAIKARLDKGEDFAAIAKAESKDPGSGAQGGDLGCKPAGEYVPEFEEAMDKLQPGQISEPVATQFGFHIIKVQSRQSVSAADADPELAQQLQSQALGEFADTAMREAKVDVNPKFGRFDARGAQPGVIPPSAPSTTVPNDVTEPAPAPAGEQPEQPQQ